MNLKNKKGLIIFVRHGQTDWNIDGRMQGREDIPLNSTGLEQAEFTAQGIKKACDVTGIVFDKVVSSPLKRASVTGKMIADAIFCRDFSCDEGVIERDFGSLSGTPYDKNSQAITKDVDGCHDLEKVENLIRRVDNFIKRHASQDKNILVVTHGAVTRIYADNAKKVDGYEIKDPFLKNCHLVVYEFDGHNPVLMGYNISSHGLDEFLEGK